MVSYLWHNNIDLGVIAKILGHKDISMLVEVYGHTLEEKISEEFMAVKSCCKNTANCTTIFKGSKKAL